MAISSNLAKFRKTGDTIDYKPGSATPAGTIVKVGGVFGLALWDIAANEAATLKVLHRGDVVRRRARRDERWHRDLHCGRDGACVEDQHERDASGLRPRRYRCDRPYV